MKNRITFGQLLAIILFMGVLAGTAHSSVLSNVAVSYVENALIPIEAKNAILAVISNDKNANEWITVNDNIMYSLCVLCVPDSKSKKPAVIKAIERDIMKMALIKAETNIALYLDKGRLNRKVYTDKEAADFALRTSYSARVKGVHTSANIIESIAVGLVSANLSDVHIDETLPEKTITENYCSYLYRKAPTHRTNVTIHAELFRTRVIAITPQDYRHRITSIKRFLRQIKNFIGQPQSPFDFAVVLCHKCRYQRDCTMNCVRGKYTGGKHNGRS